MPVDDEDARQKLINNLDMIFRDTAKARRQLNDGTYERVKPAKGAKVFRSQEWFYQQACEANRQAKSIQPLTFQPERPSAIKP